MSIASIPDDITKTDPEDGGPVCQDCGKVCFGSCADEYVQP